MPTKNQMNWNTLLLTLLIGVVGFFGKETWLETKKTREAVIRIEDRMAAFQDRLLALEVKFEKVEAKKL